MACGFNAEGRDPEFQLLPPGRPTLPCTGISQWGRTAYPRDGFFLRAESFYNVATNIDEMDEGAGAGWPGH